MTLTYKLIALLVGLLLFTAAGLQLKSMWSEYKELQEYKLTVEAQQQAASENLTSLDRQTTARQTVEIKVSDTRATNERAIEELKRNDQEVADWSAQLIPAKLRELDAPEAERGVADSPSGG